MNTTDNKILELDLYKFFSCLVLEYKKLLLIILFSAAIFLHEEMNIEKYYVQMGYNQNYTLDRTCAFMDDECESTTLSTFPLYAKKLLDEDIEISYHNVERNLITFTMKHADPLNSISVINSLNRLLSKATYENSLDKLISYDRTFDKITTEISQETLISDNVFVVEFSRARAEHENKISLYEKDVMLFDFVLLNSKKARPTTYIAVMVLLLSLAILFFIVIRKYRNIIFY